MSINKMTITILAIISVTVVLQFSHAQSLLPVENTVDERDHIVTIVDPALVAGTEVLIEDL
ncbi:MAG: hypothetical protein KAG34_08955 [Cocleimonas sp.]|nr:hypothetical protein [Cocleimonas sp.]